MMTVKIHDTNSSQSASAQVIAKTAGHFNVTDKRGRVLTIKRPNLLKQFDLLEALGDLAENVTYRIYVTPIIYLTAIDGENIDPPLNRSEIKALIQRLDTDGFEALTAAIKEHFPTDTESRETKVKKLAELPA
jgi:hypothetical protein